MVIGPAIRTSISTRRNDDDQSRIFDLLECEDTHFGTILAYNEPAGPYNGFMKHLDSPQMFGLGRRSIATRGDYSIVSGQEYRSGHYGHLNLFLLDRLVLDGQSLDADALATIWNRGPHRARVWAASRSMRMADMPKKSGRT